VPREGGAFVEGDMDEKVYGERYDRDNGRMRKKGDGGGGGESGAKL